MLEDYFDIDSILLTEEVFYFKSRHSLSSEMFFEYFLRVVLIHYFSESDCRVFETRKESGLFGTKQS
jgi:hypothetical protein